MTDAHEPRRSRSTFRVRYGETDQMGVAYHANYLVWCEIGRTDYIRERGITYAELERRGTYLAVAEANVRYGAAARYDDPIVVETWVESVKSRTVTFAYEILRDGPEPIRLARARTVLVSIDHAGATRTLPPDVMALFREKE